MSTALWLYFLTIGVFLSWLGGGAYEHERRGGTRDQRRRAVYAWRVVRAHTARAREITGQRDRANRRAAAAERLAADLGDDLTEAVTGVPSLRRAADVDPHPDWDAELRRLTEGEL